MANEGIDPAPLSIARRRIVWLDATATDSAPDSGLSALHVDPAPAPHALWAGWRPMAVLLFALVGALAAAALLQALMRTPHLDALWGVDAHGRIELLASTDASLRPHTDKALAGVSAGGSTVALDDAEALGRSGRWVIPDAERARQRTTQERLGVVLANPSVTLHFTDGSSVDARPALRRVLDLPLLFWLMAVFGAALYVTAAVVVTSRPSGRNLVYAAMALCQCGNLLLIGMTSTYEIGLPTALARWDTSARTAFDLFTAAAMINAACLHPRRLPGSGWIALGGWLAAAVLAGGVAAGWVGNAWWTTQIAVVVMGLLAIGLLSWSYQIEPHPFAIVLRRFGVVTVTTWVLLTAALAATDRRPGMPHNVADIGSLVWYVFLGSMLLLVPFLARSQSFMREFSLLAAISTVATSLNLLFVAVFAFGPLTSLALALFVSLAIYAGVRQWILNQLLGTSMLSTERMFEQLYRIAHEVEAEPERTPTLLSQLLGDLFEPLEISLVERRTAKARVAGDGSSMLVPVPMLGGENAPRGSVVIRFAQRGRRLFTLEDARLTDRIVEQLRRAVHFDKAVEQGRSEERMRLAQDLHDDIGARLLTLMYKAQSPEMEDYLRHTLQDLKTLTRGLAASNHRLSHAAAEWKSDLTHRLTAAHVELHWTVVFDEDIQLTVVHWSALTRILRELVSNTIAHAQAQRLAIEFRLEGDRVELTITDDGIGRNPRGWAHGLGLGGIRKRVKQLGGAVEWREVSPRGIRCAVVIGDLTSRT